MYCIRKHLLPRYPRELMLSLYAGGTLPSSSVCAYSILQKISKRYSLGSSHHIHFFYCRSEYVSAAIRIHISLNSFSNVPHSLWGASHCSCINAKTGYCTLSILLYIFPPNLYASLVSLSLCNFIHIYTYPPYSICIPSM